MLKFIIVLLAPAFAQTFDVYPPGKPGPTLLFVHGGAWVTGRKEQYAALGRAWAKDGVCAVIIDYHLAPAFTHPRPVEDLEHARATFTKNPPPACDAHRVVMMGHSAGAHAIAAWATAHDDATVRGFIGLGGIYDLPKLAARWPAYPNQFLKAAFGAASRWAAASPTRQRLRARAPWRLVHARGDELVDRAQTLEFAGHLKNLKITNEVEENLTADHFGLVDRYRADPAARATVIEFIQRVGQGSTLPGGPAVR